MEKIEYMTPEMEVITMKIHQPLLDASVDDSGGGGGMGGDDPVTPDPGFGPA